MALVKLEIRNECGTEMKNVKDILISLGHDIAKKYWKLTAFYRIYYTKKRLGLSYLD